MQEKKFHIARAANNFLNAKEFEQTQQDASHIHTSVSPPPPKAGAGQPDVALLAVPRQPTSSRRPGN